ncbi:MAG: polysaccharide deacetylase family protein [Nitrospiraceae bacterium]|nr:MAG: polysaccharide deacetylase family protein [Nitrospiraceae bacterium]
MPGLETKQIIKRYTGKFITAFSLNKSTKLSVILNYHSVHPTHNFATTPNDFLQQMEYLVANFTMVSLPDFYKLRIAGKSLPDRLAIITFDDGYEDNYTYAFPVLKQFGIKATVFLTTGFINGEVDITEKDGTYQDLKALTWEQVREMRGDGISFGAHTHTHPILTEISLDQAEGEISRSKKILEEKLGEPAGLFAYPFGQPKTFNRNIIDLLKKHGFKSACSTLWGCNNSNVDIFSLNRIRIDACDTFHDFKEKVNGKWEFIKWIQALRG